MGKRKTPATADKLDGDGGLLFDESGNLIGFQPDAQAAPVEQPQSGPEASAESGNEFESGEPGALEEEGGEVSQAPSFDNVAEATNQEDTTGKRPSHNWEAQAKGAQRSLNRALRRIRDLEREVAQLRGGNPGDDLDDDDRLIEESHPEVKRYVDRRLGDTPKEAKPVPGEEAEQERRQLFMDQVYMEHPEALKVIGSPGFQSWLGQQRPAIQQVMRNTWEGDYEPEDVIDVLSRYIATTPKAGPATPATPPPGVRRTPVMSGGTPGGTPTVNTPADVFSYEETMVDDNFLDRNMQKLRTNKQAGKAFLEKFDKSVAYWSGVVAKR